MEERHPCPERPDTQAAAQLDCAAQQQHDELRDNGDGEAEERQNDEGNGELRENGGEVGNWQLLQEQEAAIAELSAQRVERVENPDYKTRPHDQSSREFVRYVERLVPMHRAERQRDQEGEQKNGGGRQRGDIYRTVLPQFAPHRPVHAPTGGDARRRGYFRFEGGLVHGGLWRTHPAPPFAGPLLLLCAPTNK